MKSNSRQAALWAAAADVEENVRAVRRGRVVADLKQSGTQWSDSANKGAAARRCGPPYTVVLDSDYQTLCPWAETVISGRVWDEEMTDAVVEVLASEADNREQRRAKKAEREKAAQKAKDKKPSER